MSKRDVIKAVFFGVYGALTLARIFDEASLPHWALGFTSLATMALMVWLIVRADTPKESCK